MTIIRADFGRPKRPADQTTSKDKKIPGYQLSIELSYSSPAIRRTVNIPGTLTLADLHTVIQHCFGWQDEAAHRFLVGKIFYSPDSRETTGGSRSSSATALHEVEKDMGFIFSYLYDGGCGWECEITLDQTFGDARTIPHPVLTAAEGASPPPCIEDIHDYQSLLAELARSPESHDKILAAHGVPSTFTPNHCDMTAINTLLSAGDSTPLTPAPQP